MPCHPVHAIALIEAYLPGPDLDRTADPLLRHLRHLRHGGALSEEVIADTAHTHRSGRLTVTPDSGHVVDPGVGCPHPRRITLGAPTNSRALAAFARPRTNAPAFRQNDAGARALLTTLTGPAAADHRPERPAAPVGLGG
ncbi:hypothetical protein [Streptomyces sparsogenes]|uniref:hypothetical protein n=1 Tax=Streptomyces sparsogenes TaxID=67365 RepID=UPI0008264900|nr:hypothetical protein [Streptomyces sparsogenes]